MLLLPMLSSVLQMLLVLFLAPFDSFLNICCHLQSVRVSALEFQVMLVDNHKVQAVYCDQLGIFFWMQPSFLKVPNVIVSTDRTICHIVY